MTPKELRSAIEAILLIAGEPVTLDELAEAFSDEGREAVEQQLVELQETVEREFAGFRIELTGGGYRFATRPEHDPVLKKFFAKKGEGRLSLAALETLSIIAYRQPVTAPEISDIRGVNTSGVVRTLLERKLIRISGRKNVVGSPFLYRTTREFLTHFGLNTIQDLPRLEEFAEVLGENLTEELAGIDVEESAAGVSREGADEPGDVAPGEEHEAGIDITSGATEPDEMDADVAPEEVEPDGAGPETESADVDDDPREVIDGDEKADANDASSPRDAVEFRS
ncbi:MAG: SMC-Scp complex subunit ScpB [Thermoanaerobaculia bacterium]